MSVLSPIFEIPVHAAQLLGIALVPKAFMLDGHAVSGGWAYAASAFASSLLCIVVVAANSARLLLKSREATVAMALSWSAVAVALVSAIGFSGANGPLMRGLPYVAVFVWGALAAYSLASARARNLPIYVRALSALAVLLLGGVQLAASGVPLKSADAMWRESLRRDPENEHALAIVTAPLMRERRFEEARKVADTCVATEIDACACYELRADIALRERDAEGALQDARTAVSRCPRRARSRASLAQALALHGEPVAAEREAAIGFSFGDGDSSLYYARALALEHEQRYVEAREQTRIAIEKGAGRDAILLAAALAIVQRDYTAATQLLVPLKDEDARDVDALYDLALIDDRLGRTDQARTGYTAALAIRPDHADARYNLALLSLRTGARTEAVQQVWLLAKESPRDPRAAVLARAMGLTFRAP